MRFAEAVEHLKRRLQDAFCGATGRLPAHEMACLLLRWGLSL
jgi:hypothetical protein